LPKFGNLKVLRKKFLGRIIPGMGTKFQEVGCKSFKNGLQIPWLEG